MVCPFQHFSLSPEVNKSLYQLPVTSPQSLVTHPSLLADPLRGLFIPFSGLSADLEDGRILIQMADAFHEELFIEVQIGHEVDLVQEDYICFFKSERILVRLIAAVCHADDEELDVLADVQLRRADEISYIFKDLDRKSVV